MAEPISTPESLHIPEVPPPPVGRVPTRAERVRAAMGKFAWIPFSSDDHIREKQEELDREDRAQRDREQQGR
jgi:hypothetical protein